MRIEILHRTSYQGKPALPGELLEVMPKDGRYLVAVGKAIEVQDPAPISESPKPTRKPRTRKGTDHGRT